MLKDNSDFSKLESAKLNVTRAWHVAEQSRAVLLQSTELFKADKEQFEIIESLIVAAVTLLRETHRNMTEGDEVADTPPSVL